MGLLDNISFKGRNVLGVLMQYRLFVGSIPGCGINRSPLSIAEVKDRVELYLYSCSGPSWSAIGRNMVGLIHLIRVSYKHAQ
jgi:hypothetical protein